MFVVVSMLIAFQGTNGLYDAKIAIILVIILALLVWISSFIENGFFNPICLWEITWIGSLLVARLDTDLYLPAAQKWSNELMMLIYGSTLLFYVVYRVFFYIGLMRTAKGKKPTTKNGVSRITINTISKIINTIIIIAILSYIVNVALLGGIPLFQHDLSYRITFQGTPFFTLFNLSRILSVFIPYILLSKDQSISRRQQRLSVCLFITYALLALGTGSRGVLFQWLIAFITGYLAVKKVPRVRQEKVVAIVVVLGIVLMAMFGYLREFFSTEGSVSKGFNEYLPYIIYTYIAPNFINLQTAMFTLQPLGLPLYSTEALWSILIPSSFFECYQNLSFSIGAFNVSTYMLQPYADLGFVGIGVVTFVFAAVSGVASARVQKNSLISLGIVAIMNIIVFFMQNTYIAKSASIIFWVILVIIIGSMLAKANQY